MPTTYIEIIQCCLLQWINTVKTCTYASTWLKIALLYLIFLFFVHHGRKIAPAFYIYPSTATENNTERFVWLSSTPGLEQGRHTCTSSHALVFDLFQSLWSFFSHLPKTLYIKIMLSTISLKFRLFTFLSWKQRARELVHMSQQGLWNGEEHPTYSLQEYGIIYLYGPDW